MPTTRSLCFAPIAAAVFAVLLISACSDDNDVSTEAAHKTPPAQQCVEGECDSDTTTVTTVPGTLPTADDYTRPGADTTVPTFLGNAEYPSQANQLIKIQMNQNVNGDRYLRALWGCSAVVGDEIVYVSRDSSLGAYTFEANVNLMAPNWRQAAEDIWGNPDVDWMAMTKLVISVKLPYNTTGSEMEDYAAWLNDLLVRNDPCGINPQTVPPSTVAPPVYMNAPDIRNSNWQRFGLDPINLVAAGSIVTDAPYCVASNYDGWMTDITFHYEPVLESSFVLVAPGADQWVIPQNGDPSTYDPASLFGLAPFVDGNWDPWFRTFEGVCPN